MFTTLEIRLIGCLVAVMAIFGLGAYFEHRGASKCEANDAQVAAIQMAAAKEQEATDAKRVKDAEDGLNVELAENQRLRAALPVDHVVCYAPTPQPVPAAAKVSASHPAAPGLLPQPRASNPVTFDPGPALDQLHDYADDILAKCRELDKAVPH